MLKGNYVLKELPGDMTEGKSVVYPKIKFSSHLDYERVMSNMRMFNGTLGEGVIRSVFSALSEAMMCWLPLGHTMKIDGLGTFSLSLGFDTSSPSEEVEMMRQEDNEDFDDPKLNYRHVCIKGINFKPDPDLLREMNRQTSFNRVGVEVEAPKSSPYSREERLAKAKEIISSYGYMTLSDYAVATRQSKSSASKDLSEIVADVNSGITVRGMGSHKIWIKKAL